MSAGNISGYLPATLGNYNQQALSFSTLANGMPILNSLPSAPTSIFLDFDGDTTTGTQAYSEDADGTTFNTSEKNNIANAWKQISQYFSIFDVNVTTIESATPKAWNAVGNNIVGGYSYVGVFPNTYPRSFNNSGDARTRVSGMAHELGHNFGLQHQSDYDLLGNKTAEYSSGFDSLHGPIMGVDYAQSVHKWFIGHGSNSASTLQDDMAAIANRIKAYQPAGGDGFRADDFGNTIATASSLTPLNEQFVASGVLERMSDVDVFQFSSTGGVYTVAALPDGVSGVDLKLDIYDVSGNLIASKDGSTNYQYISMQLATGTYYAMLSSHGNYGDVGAYNVVVNSVPNEWTTQDVGSVGLVGSSTYNSATGVYSVEGSGSDIGGTADGMQFAWQTLTGDGTIIARVDSMTGTATGAKTGLEIRETTANNSKHVAMVQTWGSAPRMLTRSTTGGSTTAITTTAAAFAPIWLKLTRVGNVFTSYTSNDGATWTQFGSSTVAMAAQVKIGLVSSAASNTKLNLGTLSNVSLSGTLGTAAPVYNGLTSPTGVSITPASGTGLSISWIDGVSETGYRVERSTDGVNFTSAGTVAANVTTFTDPNLAGSLRYFYRVIATDASGDSLPSIVTSGINRPSAVTNFSITSLDTTRTVLNWRDTNGESGYRVERSTDGVNFTAIATLGTNIPSYTDTGLTVSTSYTYRVTPLSSLGDGISATAIGGTRLPAVTGSAFNSVASTAMSLRWTDMTYETSYRIMRSTDGTTYTTLATVGANTTTYTDSTVTAANEYYYRVIGVNSVSESLLPTAIFAAAPSATTLPSPWSASDIGAVTGTGTTDYNAGTFKVISSGADIWGTADAFRYTYQPLTGDGTITAKVNSAENTAGWAKLGVMVRETLAANSKQAMVVVSPSNGVAMQYRTATAGSSTSIAGSAVAAPYWVRMVRAGNLLTSYSSADGVTWNTVGSVTISMASTVYIGLAADANTNSLLNTSTFTNVTVSNNAPTVATAATATPSTVVGNTTSLSALAADDHGEANLTYSWSTTSKPSGAANPSFSVSGTNAAKNSVATFSSAGLYTLQVTMTDAGGLSATSSVNVTVQQTLTSVVVMPAISTINGGTTLQLAATAYDQFGAALVSPPLLTWNVTGGGTVSSTGLYTAPFTAASATITAAANSVSGTAFVSVLAVNQSPTIVNPATASPSTVAGTTTNLSVLAADDNGEANITYSWSTTNKPAGAADPSFSMSGTNAAKNSVATFLGAGVYTLQVTMTDSGNLSVTNSVIVTVQQTLTSIVVSPANSTINGGSTLQLAATAYDQFGVTLDSQPLFNWSVAGGGSISSLGLYTAPFAAASATVTASNGSISGVALLTVLSVNQSPSIVNAPSASPNPVAGTSTNVSVTASDDNGEANLVYTWITTAKPVGAADPVFSANGTNSAKNATATFTQAGDYGFSVQVTDAQNASVSAGVTVSVAQTATSLTISPASVTLAGGANQSFVASVLDQFAQALVSQPAVSWTLSGVGSLDANGNYTASDSSGSALVTAASGALSAAANVSVVNQGPTVATPASTSAIPVTTTLTTLSVLGADDRGENTLNYNWSVSSKPAGAADPAFSANGSNAAKSTIATFSQAGSYSFLVTLTDLGGLSTTSTVNVTVAQTATNVTVTPNSVTMNVNTAQQFTAVVKDQFGAAIASPAVSWTIQSGGGSINSTGLYTASSAAGSAIIRASSGAAAATASITILNPAPATPTGLTASNVTANSAKLNWSSTGLNTVGFYVEYSTNGTTWTRITLNSATARSYTITGLASNTSYQFRVAAFGPAGLTSPYSNVVTAKTKRR